MTAITAVQGDITSLEVDVIVNAANEMLAHGGGVALAISMAGGPAIDAESLTWIKEHGPLSPGRVAVTTGGNMSARWVIHVVGPRFGSDQDNEGLLRQAVVAALNASSEKGARSVAIPAISAGIFGYPRDEATAVIAAACRSWTLDHPAALDQILLVGFDQQTHRDFRVALTD